jgi:3-oxoacyl-[acyl-carrier protein] reductase
MGLPDTPGNRAPFVSTIPLGRFSPPCDVVAVAILLGSDAAEFVTGVEFAVDGGRTL